ncbi:MAG: TonB family protein [Lamprobacter sp.]|uniref:energy transducer TonB n=1 Tax=Lamprobacter sp. TaxID=3100796 RepID=UPI002B25AC58|nr:TonB family protein [Lamprobacter sp.]MEA3640505.1 TonB family protein [Lamprobacter sp.]
MPVALAIALALHAVLLFGLSIKAPSPSTRPTQTLELLVVTQPAQESAAGVAAVVHAQSDRAGETQALLPELENAIHGTPDSPDLTAAKASKSFEQPLGVTDLLRPTPAMDASERLDPAQTADPLPAPTAAPEPAPPAERLAPVLATKPIHAPAEPLLASSLDLDALSERPMAAERQKDAERPRENAPSPPSISRSELDQPPLPSVSAADIFASRHAEMADLAARIEERSHAYASRTRRKAISTATREYLYANYMEAWRRKVERIGNLNYPREARELGLFGSLILHVAVRADGSLEGIRVVRSSGHQVLDDAAIRIVELAAPFAPFPPNIKHETDVLDITRTWQFQRNHALGWGN